MEYLELIGYVLALLIGISLGLIGGGGSILTVPVLIYFLAVDAVTSTAYSLFIVGFTALVGAIRNYINDNLELKLGLIFAIPSFIAVWLTRAFLIPAIPESLGNIAGIEITKELVIIIFFAVIMVLSSYSMIKSTIDTPISEGQFNNRQWVLIILEGFIVGVVTGIVGAGGGFLIVPALVLFAKIPMKKAVGTSLMIISIKSLIGFTGDLMNPEMIMNWNLLLSFSTLSAAGIFVGIWLSQFIKGIYLKKGFGWFLLAMGVFMLIERVSNASI